MNDINGKTLLQLGFPAGKSIGIALSLLERHNQDASANLSFLSGILQSPEFYLDHPVYDLLAQSLIEHKITESKNIVLKEKADSYPIYGKEYIEQGALDQMNTAMKLPVTLRGALMPDAHQGYGLPIGGVLATKNAVIPYGVGVDIGCRMALSVYDIPADYFEGNRHSFKRELIAFTKFGAGNAWRGKEKAYHPVLESHDFKMNTFINKLYDKAAEQLGTSGGGNHFVEWGILDILQEDKSLNIPKGKYVALLSHSGSRGLGATIAGYYTRLAKEKCVLPREAANLAYFDLNSEEGLEYWIAMNLAGAYASACHQVIHDRLTKAIGAELLGRVENHHNFAWKETVNDQEAIVHRKGATPASEGTLGIIPGSMTAPGFLVRGLGELNSINSASHGAGRQLSRTKAMATITRDEMKKILADHGVTLIGGDRDEAPMAYKDINQVMRAQQDLVDIIARFQPKMVRMAEDGSKED
jgi:tRNA-splicing ligase RtcB